MKRSYDTCPDKDCGAEWYGDCVRDEDGGGYLEYDLGIDPWRECGLCKHRGCRECIKQCAECGEWLCVECAVKTDDGPMCAACVKVENE